MKSSIFTALAALAFLPLSLAQDDPGPSPTESVGCEPHGDHWHCEGPAETGAAGKDADEDDESSVDPGPSPTASVGCEPHGDHWHCEGPATTVNVKTSETPAGEEEHDHDHDHDHDHEEHDHDHEHEAGDAAEAGPSPTESVGCEPHGDHWHCDGPATPTPTSGASGDGNESGEEPETGAAGGFLVPVAGLFAAAAFAL